MKYWLDQLLVYSLFFCFSCGQSSKIADKTTSANKNLPDTDTVAINKSAEPSKDSTALSLPESNLAKSDSLVFNRMYSSFFQTIQQQDSIGFNQYIHPTFGLYIIEQPGALPKFTKITLIQNFKRSYQNQSFFSIRKELKSCNLKEEALPTFDCNGQGNNPAGFSKQDCFGAYVVAFQKNEAHKYADLFICC